MSGLSLGAKGEVVSELQTYLRDFGYFPNTDLAARHPEWRPITSGTPKEGVYDEATEAAVRELQRRNGIEPTGIAGPDTRALIDAPRCGNPDTAEINPQNKFALHVQKWPSSKREFTWKVIGAPACRKWNGSSWVVCFPGTTVPPPPSNDEFRSVANTALFLWSMETDLTFREVTGTTAADITFQFSEFHQRQNGPSGPSSIFAKSNALGMTINTFQTSNNQVVSSVIHFNQAHPLITRPLSTHFDIAAVALHEVGHALTLDHSGVGSLPVMKPAIARGPNEVKSLRPDDMVAISARFDRWRTRPGLANDLAVGSDGTVWHIGTAATPGGFRIYRWFPPTLGSAGGWQEASGNGGAVRVGVLNNGTPWVINDAGSVYWHSANVGEGTWQHIPNICAKDIGVGGNGAIWFVTCTPDSIGTAGGFKVGKLAVVGITPDIVQLGVQEAAGETHASRIAVGPDGTPWIVNTRGDVLMRRSTDAAVSSGWTTRAGIKAVDISITPTDDGTPFATGTSVTPGIFAWNAQTEVSHMEGTTKVIDIPGRASWLALPTLPSGTAWQVAAGPRTVWVTNTAKGFVENTSKTLF